MAKDKNPHEPHLQARDARIRELEHELALLRGSAPTHSPSPIDKNWFTDAIQHLLAEHNSAGINYALQQLAQALQSTRLSLWRHDPQQQTLQAIGLWQETDSPNWLPLLLRDKHHSLRELLAGRTLEFCADQSPSSLLAKTLCKAPIASATLIPIQHNQRTQSVLVLLREQRHNWQPQELDCARTLAEMITHVDERQRLLHTLSERDTRFQYAMDASRDGLWDWDIASGKVYFSPSYLRMLGYEHDGLPGHIDTLYTHLLDPEDTERVTTQYRAALENKRTHMNLEFRMRHKSGQVIWVFSRAKFVEPDDEGRPRRCVGTNADITDFVNAQSELLQAKTQADLANRTKTEFLARMSHEIRTPMNAIIGLGHLLKDSLLDEQQQSYLGSMNAAAESLLQTINQLLDFSKIESGKIILENTHFDLEQVLEKLSRLFEVSAIHRKVDIIYDIAPDVPRFLRGDASRLNQVLRNLLDNALLYSQCDTVLVRITKIKEDKHKVTLQFSIIDSGIGMSAEQISNLHNQIQHFKSTDSSTNSGFGLSICHHLVELMQGEISINSQPEKGCNIRFSAQFEHSHIGSKTLREKNARLAHLRTLVVDDNAIARDIIASTARLLNLKVDTAESAEAAIERIQAETLTDDPYQLVLMDYKMPGINGLEATVLIKSDARLENKPALILVSSYQRDEILFNQSDAELVDGFISKPVSESRLFDTISAVFGNSEEDDEIADDELSLLNGIRVLVAEDNQVNQQVISGILKKQGIDVTFANNGLEALSIFNASSTGFDIILMDIEMPEMDGFETTRIIRSGSHFPDTPIVAVTAQAMRGDRERCIKAGMNTYISKPIKPFVLYTSLADLLRSKSVTSNK